MRLLRLLSSVLLVAIVGGGCSAIINPDETRLNGGDDIDAGTGDGGIRRDAGPVVPPDAGPRRDSGVSPVDAGPRDAGDCDDPPRCLAGVLTTCFGDQACPLGCAPGGEPRCATLRPSNVPADAFDPSAESVTIDPSSGGPIFVDTDLCSTEMFDTEVRSQVARGPDLCVVFVHDLTLRSGAHLRVRGQRALVVLASGNIVIESDAALDVSAYGVDPGPAGGRGGNGTDGGADGLGLAPGRGGGHVDLFDDGGGGGGGFCGAGAPGGDGGLASGGFGREAVDVGFLIPLVAGSGGGRGEGSRLSAGTEEPNFGPGGAGGGALQLSALGTIRIDGAILAGGGGGRGGGRRATGGMNWGAGGGGGSGGAVLLEAPSVTFGVLSTVTTSGGGGGGSASTTGSGTAGTDGRTTLIQAAGGMSGGSLGAVGGAGGGGAVFNGADGGDNLTNQANGGGGGGAVGCIVVRNASGALPAGAAAHLSGIGSPALRATLVQRQ